MGPARRLPGIDEAMIFAEVLKQVRPASLWQLHTFGDRGSAVRHTCVCSSAVHAAGKGVVISASIIPGTGEAVGFAKVPSRCGVAAAGSLGGA